MAKSVDPAAARATELVEHLRAELATGPKPQRAARINYELARAYEHALGDPQRALKHYLKATELASDHIPSIRGARRMLLGMKEFRKALPLFDAEVRQASDVGRKAVLLFAKGRLLEDNIGARKDAREAYAAALEFEPGNTSILHALAQSELADRSWEDLSRTYERLASAVGSDPSHRAAIIARQAQLTESRLGNLDATADLYEAALKLDRRVPGALHALKRLHATRKRWRELARILELEAELASDAEVKALALMRAAALLEQKLGDPDGAIEVLERAHRLTPRDPELLRELCRLLERRERWPELKPILEEIYAQCRNPREQVQLAHRMGRLAQEQLKDEALAIHWYQDVIDLDPTHIPSLQALEKIYQEQGAFSRLIELYEREADATGRNPERQASAHLRIAQIYEDKLSDLDQAIVHHHRALTLLPGFEPSFKALTRLYSQLGRHRDLIDLYQRAADETAQNEHAIAHLFKIGSLYEDCLQEPVQAAFVYQKILARDPNRIGAIHGLQRTWERAGRYRELVEAIDLELERTRNPEQVVSLFYRSGMVLLDDLQDRERALPKFRRALEIKPDHSGSLRNLGRIYFALGRWDDLLDTYRRELDLLSDPSSRPGLLQKMAELCESKLGRPAQAIELYRQAVECDPRYQPALVALRRLLEQYERWDDLTALIEKAVEAEADSRGKAALFYRIGVIAEERLSSPVKAITAFEKALQNDVHYRPAVDALTRLLTEARNWRKLLDVLSREGGVSRDATLSAEALWREAQVNRDEIADPYRAVACFETALASNPGTRGALMALEELYRELKRTDKLEQLYSRQAQVLSDTSARVAALTELARLHGNLEQPDLKSLQATYDAILELAPNDLLTLTALENRALIQSDRALLAEVDRRMVKATAEPDLQAAFLTRLAETQELAENPEALQTYSEAIAIDPQNLSAARGYSRMADALNDPEALEKAAQYEVDLVQAPEVAAQRLVRAAVLLTERETGIERPQKDLTRALEIWPDQADVASRLIDLLKAPEEVPSLVDTLTRAAESARSDERKSSLWMELSVVQEQRQGDLSAAIRSLQRLLKINPGHAQALARLADLCRKDAQWLEATRAMERLLDREANPTTRLQLQLVLAQIHDERLDDPRRAMDFVKAALDADPASRPALLRSLDLQARMGQAEKAALSVRKLLKATQEPAQRAALLLRLGRFEHQLGRPVAAAEAFEEAVSLEGTRGEAGEEYRRLVGDVGSWTRYAGAIERYLNRQESEGEAQVQDYVELARLQIEQIHDSTLARSTLERARTRLKDGHPLQGELARLLVQAQQHEEALGVIQQLVDEDVALPDAWRWLSAAHTGLGHPVEAAMALQVLHVLELADEGEREAIGSWKPRTDRVQARSITPALLRKLGREDDRSVTVEALLATLPEALSRIYPADMASYPVNPRDRMAEGSAQPARKLVDPIAQVFGGIPFDLYLHDHPRKGVCIELSDPPALLLPRQLTDLPRAQQVYLVAQPLALMARGLAPLWKRSARELGQLLDACARLVSPRFTTNVADGQTLDELGKRINKALSRKNRKAMEEAARRYAALPLFPVEDWMSRVERGAARAALLLADDLTAAVAAIRSQDPHLASLTGVEIVKQSLLVKDIVGFWMSDQAVEVRQQMGIQ